MLQNKRALVKDHFANSLLYDDHGVADKNSNPPIDFDRITARSHGQNKVGKDPMSFGLYKQVAMVMLQSTSRDMIFAKAFMILSWNIMSRAANTVSIVMDTRRGVKMRCVSISHI
ncbi:hypothetical protein PHMEG_0003976 [Phytophthora megakarya]|uniref:Uncharacterized protein n=1 Tax=Phytophthora megakarya TaxID=4795 RepID=A0A225WUW4_9STRA|nr:hypothetical protein PHMEG_0003976 [Phytophthora megakarya]